MLYSNFMNCKSLRELQTQISHNNKLKRIINIPSVSQFSRIELFFKWIKQNLRIKKFIGYNENAVRIQIFSALITYMLIYLFCKKQNSKVKYSILIVTRIIRSNLLEIYYRGIINLSG